MTRRLLHLLLASGLALAALLLLAASVSAGAAAAGVSQPAVTFAVNSFLDAPDNNLGDNLCDTALPGAPCTLRAAVEELNHDFGGVVNLPPGVYTLTDTADGDVQLQKNIALHGLGPSLAVIQGKPGWAARILRVQSGAEVILNTIAISGGKPAAGLNGGGLDVVSGTVLLVDSLVANNQAANGGGIANSGVLIVDRSTIRDNGAYTYGGGIYNAPLVGTGGYLTVSLSAINDNITNQLGGGLANEGQALVLTSTINRNEALAGGGVIDTLSGTLSIAGSEILANQANPGYGGGVVAQGVGSVTQMANSTVSGNLAASLGGGVAAAGASVDLFNVSVVSNTANTAKMGSDGGGGGLVSAVANFNVVNTLVAQNADGLGLAPDCTGTFGLIAYDLVQNTAGCAQFASATGDVTGVDPQLLPLGNYGGPTLTYALQLNSPAVDAGDPSGCRFGLPLLATDQRGRPRRTDGNGDGVARCDIGAYELQVVREFLPLLGR